MSRSARSPASSRRICWQGTHDLSDIGLRIGRVLHPQPGNDRAGQRDWITDAEIPLIGSTGLSRLYARAFAVLGARTRILDATDATLAGLKAARAA